MSALAFAFAVASARVKVLVPKTLEKKLFVPPNVFCVRSSPVEKDFATNFLSTDVPPTALNFLFCAELESDMSGRRSRSASLLSCSWARSGREKLVRQSRKKIPRTPATLPQAFRACKEKSAAAPVAQ